MITDSETNFVYISSLLKSDGRYHRFWNRLKSTLEKEDIPFGFLEGTKDIWCRDYMPVQISVSDFVQFQYRPEYCSGPRWQHKLTKPEEVRIPSTMRSANSDLVIDGGNVVKSKHAIVLTEKVFKDNPEVEKEELINVLQKQLRIKEILLIPRQPYDMTGHSDGMLRFLNDNTLLVSDYQAESVTWKKKYAAALKTLKREIVLLPSVPLDEKNEFGDYSARGCYINFAQVGNIILLPFFNLAEDELVHKEMKKLFPACKILPVEANEIAMNGGVLNCITWNIKI